MTEKKVKAKASTTKPVKKADKAKYELPADVQAAMAHLNKEFGKGSIMQMCEGSFVEVQGQYSTNSIALDIAIGLIRKTAEGTYTSGIPHGRIIEVYGPESSGKTTFCNHIMASAQRQNQLVAMIDMEQTWDPSYARNLGVNPDPIVISQPSNGEQGLDTLEALIRTGSFGVIVVDSVAALVPKAEIEGQMGDSHMGLHARLMSQALRKIGPIVNETKTCVVFTNQLRSKIGVMFGSPETTTGGNALKFYASMRFDMRRIASLKNNDGIEYGHRCRVKVVKNKLAPPFRIAEFDMIHGKGIHRPSSVLDVASDYGLIDKRGSWFAYGGESIGQGKENTVKYLEENPELIDLLESEILGKVYEDLYL